MGKLTRIALFVFVIAAVLGVGTLATLWFAWDPLLPFAAGLAAQEWFDIALLVLLGVTAAGLFAALVWALAAPAKARSSRSCAITAASPSRKTPSAPPPRT